MNLFVDDEYTNYDYIQTRLKYFDHVYRPTIYVELNKTTDFYSEEAQFEHYKFEQALQRCDSC